VEAVDEGEVRMEQRHTQEQGGKRPIALPIALVLLVFSLIGNVFFYSLHIQNKQQGNYETGLRIYDAAEGSFAYFQGVNAELGALLQSSGAEERLEVKYRLGAAAEHGAAVADLAEEGAVLDQSFFANTDALLARIVEIGEQLGGIGNYDGPLSAEDRLRLEELKSLFERNESAAAGFNFTVKDNRNAVIRLAAGYGWIDLAKDVYASFLEQ